jgi:hypothetical protein
MARQQLHCDRYISLKQPTNCNSSSTHQQQQSQPWNATTNQLMQPQEKPKPKQVTESHLPKAQSRHPRTRTLNNRRKDQWKRPSPTSNDT